MATEEEEQIKHLTKYIQENWPTYQVQLRGTGTTNSGQFVEYYCHTELESFYKFCLAVHSKFTYVKNISKKENPHEDPFLRFSLVPGESTLARLKSWINVGVYASGLVAIVVFGIAPWFTQQAIEAAADVVVEETEFQQ